jgi:predicted membrane channel-forming protein YqfA (hemolysin III family)
MSKKQKNESTKDWLKRIGWVGILFFIIKGTITTYLLFQAGKCAMD